MKDYLIITKIGGYITKIEVSAENPDDAIVAIKDLLKEIEIKVEELRVADKNTGYFLRGY